MRVVTNYYSTKSFNILTCKNNVCNVQSLRRSRLEKHLLLYGIFPSRTGTCCVQCDNCQYGPTRILFSANIWDVSIWAGIENQFHSGTSANMDRSKIKKFAVRQASIWTGVETFYVQCQKYQHVHMYNHICTVCHMWIRRSFKINTCERKFEQCYICKYFDM